MEKFKELVRQYFKTRTVGFYIMLATAVLALVENFIYFHYYQDTALLRYYSPGAFAVPFVAVALCLVLSLFKVTDKWAALVLYGLEVCAFVLFIDGTYLYLSSAFYSGVNMEAIFSLSPGFLCSVVFYLVILIASGVCVFLRLHKREKQNGEQSTAQAE